VAHGAAGLLGDERRLDAGAQNGGEAAAHRRGDGGRDEAVAAAWPAAVRATRLGQRRSGQRLSGGGVTWSGTGGASEAVGAAARRGREAGGASEAVGAARRGRRARGVLSGRAARGSHTATARCHAGPARRGDG
jgi:hypothetical protein